MIRRSGYWIVNCNSYVRQMIFKCVTCRSLRGTSTTQQMANLPEDRIDDAPPFTSCGVDLFGPFLIKDGRRELKRYGSLFTCLASRAVHIEATNSLSTDSFIQALRRFLARRGKIRLLRCDNGTNFVGAESELRKAWDEMDNSKIASFLQHQDADWIHWKRNPPSASNFGGVWERHIRTVRSILSSLLRTHGTSFDDESFRTLMVEVEGIINSLPMTVDNLSDVNSFIPISPINILTMKSNVVLPPPGKFDNGDMYSRRRWCRIQHVANEFWSRYRKEYVHTLQQRNKWQKKTRNYEVGDVVLLREDGTNRNDWRLARVTKTHPSKDDVVRSVELITSKRQELVRPTNKLELLLENE